MADWFVYDWEVRGEPATFHVDLEYENIPEGYPYMLCCGVTCATPGEAFTQKELARAERLLKKLKKNLADGCFVGNITMDALLQYYFYLPDAGGVDALIDELSYKEHKLSLHHTVSEDPDWTVYRDVLFPDGAKYQTELNAELIEQQRKLGDALEKVRRLSLLLCFPHEQDKVLFQEYARQAGFAIGDSSYASELHKPHLLYIHVLTTLDKRKIDAITTRAIRTAEAHYGELIRWTCPKMARKSPLS